MIRLFLITLLVLSSGPAYAEWVMSGENENDTVTSYVDPETIRREGNFVKMWVLDDHKTTQSAEDKSYLSLKALDEYDCAKEQIRNLELHTYSGQMGTGAILGSSTDPGSWRPVMPGSIGQTAWKFACAKK